MGPPQQGVSVLRIIDTYVSSLNKSTYRDTPYLSAFNWGMPIGRQSPCARFGSFICFSYFIFWILRSLLPQGKGLVHGSFGDI